MTIVIIVIYILFFLFSAHESKKLVTVWAKYLNVSERYHLAFSKNTTDYEVLLLGAFGDYG